MSIERSGVFRDSAMQAVRQWEFKPDLADGHPALGRVRALLRYMADTSTDVALAPAILPDSFGDRGTPRNEEAELFYLHFNVKTRFDDRLPGREKRTRHLAFLASRQKVCRFFAGIIVIGPDVRLTKREEENLMPQYVLLLHSDGEAWKKLSPEEMQKKVEKYLAWRNKPFVVAGAGLVRDTGRVIRAKGDDVSVTEGPFSESAEVMGGFYTIEAADYDEAVKLTRDIPHIGLGTIEIRQVMVYNT